MTSVVTGACGFIGSHVAHALFSQNKPLRVFVRADNRELAEGAQDAKQETGHLEIAIGDMADINSVRDALTGAKVVYHCAAATDDSSATKAQALNLGGLRNILETLRGTRCRLVLLSGLSVLGLQNRDPLTEELPCRQCADYEIDGKRQAEALAWDYRNRYGMEVCILRAGFVYGPRDRRNLPQLVNAIREGSFVYIGNRRNLVPLVHVEDMARAIVLAGHSPAADGRVYHIADGSRTTLRDLATLICELVGRPRPRWTIPYYPALATCSACEQLQRHFGWPKRGPIARSTLLFLGTSRYVDIRRAKEELGFIPRIGFRHGMPVAVRAINGQTHGEHIAV